MKKYGLLLVPSIVVLSNLAVGAQSGRHTLDRETDRHTLERELTLFGPAAGGLQAAGFNPRGRLTVLARRDFKGTDSLHLEVEGLPANGCLTVFLTEQNDFPFCSLQFIAEVCTNRAGRGSVNANLIVVDAFALKTEANVSPPPFFVTPVNVDLNHIVLWFADSADDDAFTPLGAGPFDADRDSGVAVLRTENPLP